jgi:endonuclease YncB( thermonuclease family)
MPFRYRALGMRAIFLTAALLAFAAPAFADPCEAIPQKGPMPSYLHHGASFSGPVPYIGDGDSLCVAIGPDASDWVEVRLADFYAPELHEAGGEAAKAALSRIALGRTVSCAAEHRSYDRVVARCALDGVSLGDRLRRAGVEEGGRGRR